MTMEGLKIYGGGGTRFQPVYVGDVAQAIITCLEDAETNGKTYELGGPQIYSFCELMELILQHTCRWRPLIPIPFSIASAMGFFMGFLPKPILTLDQVRQLAIDNVVNDTSLTLLVFLVIVAHIGDTTNLLNFVQRVRDDLNIILELDV